MKKLFFLSAVVLGFVALFTNISKDSKGSDITLENVLAINSAQAEGETNHGPVSVVDCAGLFTGTKKVCLCYVSVTCAEAPCS